jgi:hypothetical protein
MALPTPQEHPALGNTDRAANIDMQVGIRSIEPALPLPQLYNDQPIHQAFSRHRHHSNRDAALIGYICHQIKADQGKHQKRKNSHRPDNPWR